METHPNAYAMELQEKKAQYATLGGEIAALEKKVNPKTPTETDVKQEADKELNGKNGQLLSKAKK